MNVILHEYLAILIFILVAIVLSIVLFGLSYLFSTASHTQDAEKVSAYECGFNPFEDARNQFDVRFYIVAILFIIFDLEVTFLVPWSICLREVGDFGFWSIIVFLGVLTLGFIYEWRRGALDWS